MALNARSRSKNHRALSQELNDIIGGASGGFLFGIPLLYTMEVWFIGSEVQPPILLAVLVATFAVVLLLNRAEGFRRSSSGGFWDGVGETIEAMAIGMVCAALMLVLFQEITLGTPLSEALGKIIFEGVPFSLGVALSRAILSGDRWNSGESQSSNSGKKNGKASLWKDTISDLSATAIGAIIIAFNIAPTDEVPMMSAAASPPWLLAIMVVSLSISYCIVFASGFTSQKKRHQQQGLFQRPFGETVFSYLVSLVASALMLWFFQRLTWSDPWHLWLQQTLVLGLPATVGGAAGRLAV